VAAGLGTPSLCCDGCCVYSHEGPVWQLAWAHPVYGSVLATCGYDRKVILWKEQDSGWTKIYEYSNHDSSGRNIGSHTLYFS